VSTTLSPDPVYVRASQICLALDINPKQLARAVALGQLPPPDLYVNRKLRRWRRSTLQAVLDGSWRPTGKAVACA
jgi:hypothetical protein